MDLNLSTDQRLVQETARKFLESTTPLSRVRALAEHDLGFDRSTWARAGELGWFAALVPECDGGGSVSGQPMADAAIVAEEIGRALFPGPFLPTNVVAFAIGLAGSDEQRATYLPALIGGTSTATWAFAEANDGWDGKGDELSAAATASGFRLSGLKAFVQDAHAADVYLVTARTPGGLSQFLVPADTPGVHVTPLDALDLARRLSDVAFVDVDVPAEAVLGEVDGASGAVEHQRDIALVLICAETVGTLERCFEMTLEYVKVRQAFGRPIGSFQALKHRLTDMLLWLEGAKAVSRAAAEAVDRSVDRAELVSMAKAYISDRGPVMARECVQLHGGIAITWDFDLHLFLRRVDSNAALYGGVDHHRDRLATTLGV